MRFNLFHNPARTKRLMNLFIQDRGQPPTDDGPKVHGDLMIDFLINVNDYLLALTPPSNSNPFTKNLPGSVRWDILFRWAFPVAVMAKIAVFFAMYNSYPVGD